MALSIAIGVARFPINSLFLSFRALKPVPPGVASTSCSLQWFDGQAGWKEVF
jgi:hypothetical protein